MKRKLTTLGLGMALALAATPGRAAQGIQLPGNQIPQFVDPLPLLAVAGGPMETVIAGTGEITLNMLEFKTNYMPSTFIPANGLPYTGTWTFGYRVGPTAAPASAVGTPVGPVIVATRGVPTRIRYVNNLTTDHIAWRDWIDQSLHSAFHQIYGVEMPTLGNGAPYLGPVPAVPHLHGGEDPAAVDGGPEAYFLSNQGDFTGVVNTSGPAYYTHPAIGAAANEAVYAYPNSQIAGPLWFHDHLLGGTRINATYAGLAGAYALTDAALTLPAGLLPIGLDTNGNGALDLPGEVLEPLVIQDRMFDVDGQLFFPNVGVSDEHPIWVPEFVGDTIVVNGKVWPFLNVDRQRYRYYVINGSNSRPYDMFLVDPVSKLMGPPLWVIATDGGYLDGPVLIDPNAGGTLTMMPGERYEIIVDFGDPAWLATMNAFYGGAIPNPLSLLLRNKAPTVDGPPNGVTTGRVMQFRVSATVPAGGDQSFDPAAPGATILAGADRVVRLPGAPGGPAIVTAGPGQNVQHRRQLTLNEVPAANGEPLEALVNNTKWAGLRTTDGQPVSGSQLVNNNWLTEVPTEGDTEVWDIVNLTADSHPIHLHGVQFQIVSRQKFNSNRYGKTYAAAFPPVPGDPVCTGGVYCPGFGPPLDYTFGNPNALGGNPDVTPFLQGMASPPLPYEQGWKDTSIMHPGEVTRIVVRFAPQHLPLGQPGCFPFEPNAPTTSGDPGAYVWHCHITDHEDNEMMRPYMFQPVSACSSARTYFQGTDF